MKEEEIARLLSEGTPPAELVHQGYSRGTVYKVKRRLAEGGTTPPGPSLPGPESTDPASDPALEADSEIMELKKSLRKAQLERQLAEIRAPIDLEARLTSIEEELTVIGDALTYLDDQLGGSPLSGLREKFECACGAKGLVAVRVYCTECNREGSYGWSPAHSK